MASEREARIEAAHERLREWIGDHWSRKDWGVEGEKLHEVMGLVAALRDAVSEPSAAPASAGRAVEILGNDDAENHVYSVLNEMKSMPVSMTDDKVFLRLLRERGYGIAALRAEPSPELVKSGDVFRDLADDECDDPSPEPQRAGAGLLAEAKRMSDLLFSANLLYAPAELLRARADLDRAIRDEQALEPDGRTFTHDELNAALAKQSAEDAGTTAATVDAMAECIEKAEKRAEQAESAYKQAAAERQIAQDALRAYREQVEPLRAQAVEWTNKDENVLEAGRIVSELAALPTEPEGQAAKADAGDDERADAWRSLVLLLHHFAPELRPLPDLMGVVTQIDNLLVGLNKKADAGGVAVLRRLRETMVSCWEAEISAKKAFNTGTPERRAHQDRADTYQDCCAEIDRLLAEAESQPEGEADAWDGTLMDGLRAEPPFSLNIDEGEARVCGGCPGCIWNDCEEGYTPNPRYTLKGEAESPAKLATQRAIEADLADDEGEAREGDDVLRGFVERVENPNESNGPDAAEIDAAVAVLAKRALEGR